MWSKLGVIQKCFFIAAMAVIIPFAPELMLIVDFGGIELAFGFLLLYYQPILLRICAIKTKIGKFITHCIAGVKASALTRPRIYLVHSAFTCGAFIITGSLAFSLVFLMPTLLVNGVIV
ncbi:hypothetical protein [Thalassotalea ganghwensis]